MSIHVFARRNFKGEEITGFDADNLQELSRPMRPSSARLNAGSDRILFFIRPKWKGPAMFRTGAAVKEIANLGHPGDGGKVGFENTISSMRVSDFQLRLRFHIVTTVRANHTVFPDGLFSGADAEEFVTEAVQGANAIWSPHMIRLQLESVLFPAGVSRFFSLDKEYYRLLINSGKFDLLRAGANIIVVNNLAPGVVGKALPHVFSRLIALAPTTDLASGVTLAHELGHFFGLQHRPDSDNLMHKDRAGHVLTIEQVEEAHKRFARGSELDNGIRIE